MKNKEIILIKRYLLYLRNKRDNIMEN